MTTDLGRDPADSGGKLEFDPFSDVFFNDPYPTYRRMRDEAPVYYSDTYDFYALSRHEDVTAAYKNFETFSSSRGVDLSTIKYGFQNRDMPLPKLIIMIDPPDHNRLRVLVSRVFTPRAIASMEPMVREAVTKFLDRADPKKFDVVEDWSSKFPVEIICTMLGVPEENRQQIKKWLDISLHRQPGEIGVSEAGINAGMEAGMFYYGLIVEKR
ncbi:MAG: hypothetical protein QOJ03_1668, partial [Frankiaceae bacterium]|nr:hypothetical protein [Frankiaceae bacterium]